MNRLAAVNDPTASSDYSLPIPVLVMPGRRQQSHGKMRLWMRSESWASRPGAPCVPPHRGIADAGGRRVPQRSGPVEPAHSVVSITPPVRGMQWTTLHFRPDGKRGIRGIDDSTGGLWRACRIPVESAVGSRTPARTIVHASSWYRERAFRGIASEQGHFHARFPALAAA
jgi:hypothetical protein